MQLKIALLSLILVVFGASCTPASSYSTSSRTEESNPSSGTLPTLDLHRVSGNETALIEDRPPGGWRLSRGSNGRLSRQDGEIVLRGSHDQPLESVRLAPRNGDLLVYFSTGQYAIYTQTGELVATVPAPHSKNDNAGLISWRWKDAETLIGVSEVSLPVERPQYPDGDALPESTLLFLYRPYKDPRTVYSLLVEDPSARTVIRLEGVTKDGRLQLSAVEPTQYFGGPAREILGLFDVHDP